MVARNMLRTLKAKCVFLEKKIRFVTALDLIECLREIKKMRLLLTCTPISELPSNINTLI